MMCRKQLSVRLLIGSSIVQDTVGTSYSIDLCLRDLITKSRRQRSGYLTRYTRQECNFMYTLHIPNWVADYTRVRSADCSLDFTVTVRHRVYKLQKKQHA